ncbi:MAG TPA: hypothetical protein VH208_01870, partial [Myxococcaceae bacterium]|nr:hypothetical protein [Myxococcaceae bacterium]
SGGLVKSGEARIVPVQEGTQGAGAHLGGSDFKKSDSGQIWVPVGGGRLRLMTEEDAARLARYSGESSRGLWESVGFLGGKKAEEEKKPPPPPKIQKVDVNELVAKLREKGVVLPDQLVAQVAADPARLVALGTTDSRGYEAQTAAAHLLRLAEAGQNYDTTPNPQVVRRLFETLGTENVQTHGPAQGVLEDLKIPASEPGDQARAAADLAITGATRVGYKKRLAPAPTDFPDTVSVSRYDPAAHIERVEAKAQSVGFYKFIGDSLRNYQPAHDPDLQAAIKAGAKPSNDQFEGISARATALSKEALQVMGRLHEMGVGGSAQRILARAVDFKVGPADEPLIRPIQALNSAYAIKNAAPGFSARLGELSRNAGSDLERALLMKAMGPRAQRLAQGSEEAMQELELYAGMIRGAPRDVLIERSTVLQKAPEPEPSEFEGLFGKWKGSKTSGIANLKQQYANTCVAASCLHALGTADPVLTWLLKSEGPIGRRNPLGFQARAEWT